MGKMQFVTGGARGIGLAITQRLLASGANVTMWDRDQSALDATAKALNLKDRVHAVAVDIANPDSVRDAGERRSSIGSAFTSSSTTPASQASPKSSGNSPRRMAGSNSGELDMGCFSVSRRCSHMMANKYGRIVNIASIAGKEATQTLRTTAHQRHGVIALTKSLAKEAATTGVIVNCITPAVIQTDILKQVAQSHIDYMLSKIPMGALA
jgi:3-oxoacyl-[acyl-carrier protein] reductase